MATGRPAWAIYYDDGKIFTSHDGAWTDAPVDGVLFALELRGDRVITHAGNDHYLMLGEDGTIAPTHDLGPWLRSLGIVKFGRYTSHRTYERVAARVAEDAKKWQR